MFIRSMAVISVALVAVACGKSSISSSEVKTVTGPKGPITDACQIQKQVAFRCTTVTGYKMEVIADNGAVSVNGVFDDYTITKSVQNGEVFYSILPFGESPDYAIGISTGKGGKGIGSSTDGTQRGMRACKSSALRDTRVLDFLAQNNGICHPR